MRLPLGAFDILLYCQNKEFLVHENGAKDRTEIAETIARKRCIIKFSWLSAIGWHSLQ